VKLDEPKNEEANLLEPLIQEAIPEQIIQEIQPLEQIPAIIVPAEQNDEDKKPEESLDPQIL